MLKHKKLIIIMVFMAIVALFNTTAKAEDTRAANMFILSSSGTASINAEPDTVTFSLAVQTENKLLSQAMQENNDKATKVVSEIKKALGKDDSIKTTGFNVSPIYVYDTGQRKSILSGYRVTNMVNIRTKKIADAGKIIDKAISCGANRAENLDFIVENKDKYANDLLKQAAEKARQKAFATAQALGVNIIGIKTVSTSFSDEIISPYARGVAFSAMEMKSDSAGAPPIEAGEIKLNAVISVNFLIENVDKNKK